MAEMAGPRGDDSDSAMLALLGKKQVLKRRFTFISMFGFAVCEVRKVASSLTS